MKILQLCNKSPLPPKEGGSIAMYHLAQALISAGHEIDVLTVTTPKYAPDNKIIKQFEDKNYTFDFQYIDTDIKVSGALRSLFCGESYHVARFRNEASMKKLVHKLNEKKYDVVLFETLYMSSYLETVRQHSDAKCVLRSHNIEHQIWQGVSEKEKNILKRTYLKYLTKKLKQFELKMIPLFDAIACISEAEMLYYRIISANCNAGIVPFGISEPETREINSEAQGFYHLGSMDWMPNVEGVEWFLKYVVPILEKKAPEIRIDIAGRNMPERFLNFKSPVVNIIGEVDDALIFAAKHATLVVPLFSGSGIRIKIIEAMSLGKAVISTSIGAEGILAENGKHIFIADDPQSFARYMMKLDSEPETIANIGANAKKLIITNHNYQAVLSAFDKLV